MQAVKLSKKIESGDNLNAKSRSQLVFDRFDWIKLRVDVADGWQAEMQVNSNRKLARK